MARYLLCPQCGSHRFYLDDIHGTRRYVLFTWDGRPQPDDIEATADAWGELACCGCAWHGAVRKLVRYFNG